MQAGNETQFSFLMLKAMGSRNGIDDLILQSRNRDTVIESKMYEYRGGKMGLEKLGDWD